MSGAPPGASQAIQPRRARGCYRRAVSRGGCCLPSPLALSFRVICDYGGMADVAVRRVDFGSFVRPAEGTGTGFARVRPSLGYAGGHPRGMILFDTGKGPPPDGDAHHPARTTAL